MREVEAKARLNFIDLEKIISYFDTNIGEPKVVVKVDKYYNKKDSSDEFRVRRVNDDYIYCEKKKEQDGDFEDNIESEREITREEAVKIDSEYNIFAIKEKKGFLWQSLFKNSVLNIELFDVTNLGFFLEIEILLDDKCSNEEKDEARDYILSIFKHFALQERLEKRKYLDMLLG